MKVVQVLEEIETFRENLFPLDNPHEIFDLESMLSKNDLYNFLDNIEVLILTGIFNNELLSSIETLTTNEHFDKLISFQPLDVSDLTIDESHPDNGDVGELIFNKSADLYEELRNEALPTIEELNAMLVKLLFVP